MPWRIEPLAPPGPAPPPPPSAASTLALVIQPWPSVSKNRKASHSVFSARSSPDTLESSVADAGCAGARARGSGSDAPGVISGRREGHAREAASTAPATR